MTDFSQKRFVEIGQTLYTEWLKTATNMGSASDEELRDAFSIVAKSAFMAAEEFAKVFRHQEEN